MLDTRVLLSFFKFRVKKNGTRIYKLGCTRLNQTCEEEDRNRKKKSCCRDWFCNRNVPSHWLNDSDDISETTPTPPVNPTSPDPLDLSLTGPTIEEESPNCTVNQEDSLTLAPCAGPGSVDQPPLLEPIDTDIIPDPGDLTWSPSGIYTCTYMIVRTCIHLSFPLQLFTTMYTYCACYVCVN